MKMLFTRILPILLLISTMFSCQKASSVLATLSSSCSATAGTKTFTSSLILATVTNGNLIITATNVSPLSTTKDTMSIILTIPTNLLKVGTIPMGTIGLNASGSYKIGGTLTSLTYETVSPLTAGQTAGSLIITSYDATNKKLAGTFSFVATQSLPTPSTATIAVTNGKINIVSW